MFSTSGDFNTLKQVNRVRPPTAVVHTDKIKKALGFPSEPSAWSVFNWGLQESENSLAAVREQFINSQLLGVKE